MLMTWACGLDHVSELCGWDGMGAGPRRRVGGFLLPYGRGGGCPASFGRQISN